MSWFKRPSTEAEFDIEGLDVFSVEREGRDTTFGYRTEHKELVGTEIIICTEEQEWNVRTTDDQHRAFVVRLTTKLRNTNQSPKLEDND